MRIARIGKETEAVNQEPVDLLLLDKLIMKYKNQKGNMIPLL